MSASASGCSLSKGAAALAFERDPATGLYRISSGGMLLTESGRSAVLAGADGSASQLWRVSACEGGYAIVSASGMALDDYAQSTDEGNRVWLHAPNGTAAQAWLLADPAVPARSTTATTAWRAPSTAPWPSRPRRRAAACPRARARQAP